jgi:putative hydrolase of the HAD superfamily
MKTVLVVPSGTREVFEDDWEMEGRDAPHVDYLTDDLGAFLGDVLAAVRK